MKETYCDGKNQQHSKLQALCSLVEANLVMKLIAIAVILCSLCGVAPASKVSPKHLAKWTKLNYAWDETHKEEDYKNNGRFVVKNNEIAGIKVWKCKMFLTVPRWKAGVPSTLNYIDLPAPGTKPVADATLIPYPNWDSNEHKNCKSLQWVQSMEIDTSGIMWIIDKGDGVCPPKIVLLDLKKNGKEIMSVDVPDNIAGNTSFMNDIALDTSRQIAYISDADATDPGIIAFDYKNRKFYRFEDSTLDKEDDYRLNINGKQYNMTAAVDGIALSPDRSRVFYCPLTGAHMYSISTKELLSGTGRRTTPTTIVDHGPKKTAADGIVFDCDGNLYYAGLTSNSLWKWVPDFQNINVSNISTEVEISRQDAVQLGWIDSFGITGSTLYFTANNLHRFFSEEMDYSSANTVGNIHVWSVNIGTTSYMNCPALNRDDSCHRNRAVDTSDDPSDDIVIILVIIGCVVLLPGIWYVVGRFVETYKKNEQSQEGRKESYLNPVVGITTATETEMEPC